MELWAKTFNLMLKSVNTEWCPITKDDIEYCSIIANLAVEKYRMFFVKGK